MRPAWDGAGANQEWSGASGHGGDDDDDGHMTMRLSENEALPRFTAQQEEPGAGDEAVIEEEASCTCCTKLHQLADDSQNFFETAIISLVRGSTNGRSWEQLTSSFIEARHAMRWDDDQAKKIREEWPARGP